MRAAGTSSDAQTDSTSSRVNLPANTPNRLRSARSASPADRGSSRSWFGAFDDEVEQRGFPRQQTEPVGQAVEDLLRREDSRSDRRELDRQRHRRAGGRDPRRPPGSRRSARSCPMPAALSVKSRTASFCRSRDSSARQPRAVRAAGRDHVLTRHRQRLAAGGDHSYTGRGSDDLGDKLGGCFEQVLAVVHHQQELLVLQVRAQQRARSRSGRAGPEPP